MSCFPCFQSQKGKKANRSHHGNVERSVQSSEPKAPESKKPKSIAASESKTEVTPQPQPQTQPQPKPQPQPQPQSQPQQQAENSNINAQTFTFRELATATKNFRQECLLGEGGFGRVYKGTLQSTNKVVAVKQLDRNGLQGNKEFLVEVLMLSLLHHQNLVSLLGYCADGDQRLLVYEFMPGGSVEDRLLEKQKPLDWMTRVKIALGAAQGLEYLHDKANPPVIYRDLKASNILLDENFVPKLSDFGLAKLGPLGDKMHVSSTVMGTYGYCAPEYARTGHLTVKSDVYSFGVVLLELITGRRVIDNTRPVDEQNLIAWAQPIFRDPKKYPYMADPLLKKRFSEKGLNQAVAIAAMCLQEEAAARPLMSDVVTALTFLSKDADDIPLPRNPLSRHDGETEDDEKNTDEEDECSDEYDEDGSCYDEEENEQVENATKAGTSSNQQDKDSSVVEDQGKEGKKDEIRKSSSRRSPGSKGSEVHGASSRKTSKKLKHASTQKSRVKADGSEPLSENKRSKSLSASNHKSSRKAKDGSVSSHSKSSRKSKSRRESSRHKSSKKTPEEIPRTSSTLQASPEESQKTARELPDETAPTSQEK